MSKVVLLDCSVLSHRSIFSYGSMILMKMEGKLPPSTFIPPVSYSYFAQIISILKKIGIDKDDTVICALDHHSWRKNYDANYKAQRQEFRESFKHIDWDKCYSEINKINEQLDAATNFHFLRIENCESDDIIATACKFFSDQTCIIVSIDADLDQLAYYPNVRIFSPLVKFKGLKGAYKQVDNPLAIIEKKCRLGDVSDNIIVGPNDTIEDAELRRFIIDLVSLPEFVSTPILNVLQHLPKKELYPDLMPFLITSKGGPGLGQKFFDIYSKTNVITYDECVNYTTKRVAKKLKTKKNKKEAIARAKRREAKKERKNDS